MNNLTQLPLFDLEEYSLPHPTEKLAMSPSEFSTRPPSVTRLMNIHGEEVKIVSVEHLEELLRTTPRHEEYAAFFLWTNEEGPELWLHFNGDNAYIRFWKTTDGSHLGYQPDPSNRSKSLIEPYNITFLQIGASWGEYIQPSIYHTVPVEQAIEVAKEFGETGKLPSCINWFEL